MILECVDIMKTFDLVNYMSLMWVYNFWGIGKGPQAGTQTQDAWSAIALYVGVLPIRLLPPVSGILTKFQILIITNYKNDYERSLPHCWNWNDRDWWPWHAMGYTYITAG